MTTNTKHTIGRRLASLVIAVQALIWKVGIALAQEQSELDVDVNLQAGGEATPWYGVWWVWVLIALFVIVIVALATSGRRTE